MFDNFTTNIPTITRPQRRATYFALLLFICGFIVGLVFETSIHVPEYGQEYHNLGSDAGILASTTLAQQIALQASSSSSVADRESSSYQEVEQKRKQEDRERVDGFARIVCGTSLSEQYTEMYFDIENFTYTNIEGTSLWYESSGEEDLYTTTYIKEQAESPNILDRYLYALDCESRFGVYWITLFDTVSGKTFYLYPLGTVRERYGDNMLRKVFVDAVQPKNKDWPIFVGTPGVSYGTYKLFDLNRIFGFSFSEIDEVNLWWWLKPDITASSSRDEMSLVKSTNDWAMWSSPVAIDGNFGVKTSIGKAVVVGGRLVLMGEKVICELNLETSECQPLVAAKENEVFYFNGGEGGEAYYSLGRMDENSFSYSIYDEAKNGDNEYIQSVEKQIYTFN